MSERLSSMEEVTVNTRGLRLRLGLCGDGQARAVGAPARCTSVRIRRQAQGYS